MTTNKGIIATMKDAEPVEGEDGPMAFASGAFDVNPNKDRRCVIMNINGRIFTACSDGSMVVDDEPATDIDRIEFMDFVGPTFKLGRFGPI